MNHSLSLITRANCLVSAHVTAVVTLPGLFCQMFRLLRPGVQSAASWSLPRPDSLSTQMISFSPETFYSS